MIPSSKTTASLKAINLSCPLDLSPSDEGNLSPRIILLGSSTSLRLLSLLFLSLALDFLGFQPSRVALSMSLSLIHMHSFVSLALFHPLSILAFIAALSFRASVMNFFSFV